MTLDRAGVERALVPVLDRVPEAEFRLVGSASSVLRGIAMPAADIDVVFRARSGVDAWFAALSTDLDVERAPQFLAEEHQYFARLYADGVRIELSTVEIEIESDTMECFGSGPWRHFDVVACGAVTVPAVATELRLLTEVARRREERLLPIIEHLRTTGCDVGLIRRGLTNLDVAPDDIDRLVAALAPETGR